MLTAVLLSPLYKKAHIVSRDEQVTPAIEFPTAVFVVGWRRKGNNSGNKVVVYVCNEKNEDAHKNRVRESAVSLNVSVEA